jgi:hypothetical protein
MDFGRDLGADFGTPLSPGLRIEELATGIIDMSQAPWRRLQ